MATRNFISKTIIAGLLAAHTLMSFAADDVVPAGTYTLEKSHASLIFKVDHLGFSNYTARFKKFDATLQFDPNNPSAANLVATVDVNSLETDYPDPQKHDFNKQLLGAEWFEAIKFPKMTYRSKKVTVSDGNKLHIEGELDLHGIKQPVSLDATYNGGYAGHPMDPHARIGFSAQGSLKRSLFDIAYGIPEAGSKMGVGDTVQIIIEAEFSGPAWAGAKADAAK